MPWVWSSTTGKHTWDFLMQNNIHVDHTRLGFKSFAQFMRTLSQFKWDTQEQEIIKADGNPMLYKLQNPAKAIDNFKEL